MKLLLQFLCLCVAASVTAQVVTLSTPIKLPVKTSKFKIIGKNNDGVVVRLYGTEDVINIYDDDLKLTTVKTIEYKNQTGLLQHVMLNKTGSVIFYLQQDKKYSVLLAQPVNSKFVEIGKAISIDTIYDRKDLIANNLRFKSSVDQNYLFVYYPYFASGKVQSVKYLCLDHALNTVYNTTIAVERDEKELEESKSLIDNEGNAYLILKPATKYGTDQYDIFRVGNGTDPSVYSIVTEKGVFSEPVFDIDNKNGNMVMCSFYDEDGHQGEDVANGFLYGSYNPVTGTVVQTNHIPFPKQFITDLTGRDVGDKGKLYTFNIRKVVLRNDGGLLVMAESFIKDSREQAAPVGIQPGFSTFRTTSIYQFNDIIAFSINPQAVLEWTNIMRKKQASEDDNGAYSSFLIMNEKEKLHLVYLDDITTAGILNEYVLTSEGKSDRKALFNQEEKDLMMLPKSGKQISPKEAVMPSYKNGTLQLVKITY